jgi:hypothetical protein
MLPQIMTYENIVPVKDMSDHATMGSQLSTTGLKVWAFIKSAFFQGRIFLAFDGNFYYVPNSEFNQLIDRKCFNTNYILQRRNYGFSIELKKDLSKPKYFSPHFSPLRS